MLFLIGKLYKWIVDKSKFLKYFLDGVWLNSIGIYIFFILIFGRLGL